MTSSAKKLLACAAAAIVGHTWTAGAQPAATPASPAQTQTLEGLEISVVSFKTAQSGSLGGACPPRMAGFVQIRTKGDRLIADVAVKIKVLPTYAGAKVAKVVIEDDKAQTYETQTALEDFGNPGGEREYDCVLKFVVPKGPAYPTLRVESAVLQLPSPSK